MQFFCWIFFYIWFFFALVFWRRWHRNNVTHWASRLFGSHNTELSDLTVLIGISDWMVSMGFPILGLPRLLLLSPRQNNFHFSIISRFMQFLRSFSIWCSTGSYSLNTESSIEYHRLRTTWKIIEKHISSIENPGSRTTLKNSRKHTPLPTQPLHFVRQLNSLIQKIGTNFYFFF